MVTQGARASATAVPVEALCRAKTRWEFEEVAGRLVEISGNASVSMAMGLIVDAQVRGHPCAWVSAGQAFFFPPDAAEGGVDLQALLVVHAEHASQAAASADKLIRSGAFGVVVMDLGAKAQLSMASQARLVKLAQRHHCVVLALTLKGEHQPSLSSLVSLRGVTHRRWLGADRFRCELRVVKDKRRGPRWTDSEEMRGPAGAGDCDDPTAVEGSNLTLLR